MAVPMPHRRFTVDEYHRMGEAGILGPYDRVELIAGEIVTMSPIGGRHMGRVNTLSNLLVGLVGRDALVSTQKPIRLANDGEPQPDIALLRHDASKDAVPTPDDVILVIEVADSSLDYDRNVKLPLYAAAGIPEAWLVNLPGEMIERYSDPRDGIYRLIARARRGETLASTVLPALVLPIDAALG
ncbi:MAG: COG1355, Predicted dioxygenase [uncultured Thermomicrobiales bacterium]|uniref:COG1355, Predicted dioxygenase n=1 Tax=uncultured Thermomicrobiales bacterium TaxID=1645740 RepID=A0A6J4USN2_9BACT|nr:MAG: COG1355, Predicted dioxygenase [uncultured Thermomicrobiales bacterium]